VLGTSYQPFSSEYKWPFGVRLTTLKREIDWPFLARTHDVIFVFQKDFVVASFIYAIIH
jgi:hypothetical protein